MAVKTKREMVVRGEHDWLCRRLRSLLPSDKFKVYMAGAFVETLNVSEKKLFGAEKLMWFDWNAETFYILPHRFNEEYIVRSVRNALKELSKRSGNDYILKVTELLDVMERSHG